MKNKIKFLIILFGLLFLGVPSITQAATGQLAAGDIEMECVYDNGISIELYYLDDTYSMSISQMKLANALEPPYNTSMIFFLNESSRAKTIIQSASCPDEIQASLVQQTADDGTTISFQVLFHGDDYGQIMNTNVTKKFVAGFNATSGTTISVEVDDGSPLKKRVHWGSADGASSFRFKLKSEQIYLVNDVKPKREWAFKSEGQQAASRPSYIRIYEYYPEKGGLIQLVEKDQKITRLDKKIELKDYQEGTVQLVCFKPSIKSIENNKNDMSYVFSDIRHKFDRTRVHNTSATNPNPNVINCTTGYSKYIEINSNEIPDDTPSATSICEIIPDTALLISTIIYYAGIIIPIFLIIFTAIDISKIVISGNLDEELPKKRKLIITRFIVAIIFFFIPILIEIFVSSSYGIDFGDISCLWSTNSDEATPEASSGDDPVDENV